MTRGKNVFLVQESSGFPAVDGALDARRNREFALVSEENIILSRDSIGEVYGKAGLFQYEGLDNMFMFIVYSHDLKTFFARPFMDTRGHWDELNLTFQAVDVLVEPLERLIQKEKSQAIAIPIRDYYTLTANYGERAYVFSRNAVGERKEHVQQLSSISDILERRLEQRYGVNPAGIRTYAIEKAPFEIRLVPESGLVIVNNNPVL